MKCQNGMGKITRRSIVKNIVGFASLGLNALREDDREAKPVSLKPSNNRAPKNFTRRPIHIWKESSRYPAKQNLRMQPWSVVNQEISHRYDFLVDFAIETFWNEWQGKDSDSKLHVTGSIFHFSLPSAFHQIWKIGKEQVSYRNLP